jgi:hypothetical protein
MESLFIFIEQMCKKHNIDESHGVKHAKWTMLRAHQILSKMRYIDEDERRMALFAAALHDMCDHKYTDVAKSSREIRDWLISRGWIDEDADALIKIITTMSYSKLKDTFANGSGYPEHGKWQMAYHIARHADLLEGYTVARCILYDRHVHPERTEDQHWLRAEELFQTRIFTYVTDGWIFLPAALSYVKGLEEEAHRCLSTRSLDWPDPILDTICA